jgi:hypothetical protein
MTDVDDLGYVYRGRKYGRGWLGYLHVFLPAAFAMYRAMRRGHGRRESLRYTLGWILRARPGTRT